MQHLTTRRDFEEAAAMGASHINEIQHWCYEYFHLSVHDIKDNLHQYYLSAFCTYANLAPCPSKYRNQVVTVALYEMNIPHKSTINKYTWSGRQRANACGITRQTWSRYKLSRYVEFIIDDIRRNARAVNTQIDTQLLA